MSPAGRLERVVAGLAIGPGERVLEIGPGHGIASTLVCELIGPEGRYTGVDRSAAMIAAAEKRNARFVGDGRAEFLTGELERIELGDRRFDLVFAVRVGLFHREPERARSLVLPYLAPGGRIEAFYDGPVSP